MPSYTVPFIPASLNRFAGRNNVWAYRAEKQRWKDLCAAYCRPRPTKPIARAAVGLTFVFPDRKRRDLDNLVKYVTDGLVAAGIIKDDCWQCMELDLRGRYDKGKGRTEIVVEELI